MRIPKLTGLCANGVETERGCADFRKSSREWAEFSSDLIGVGIILGVEGGSGNVSSLRSTGNSCFSASLHAACTIPNLLDKP